MSPQAKPHDSNDLSLIHVYNAHVVYGEFGADIEDLECPFIALPIIWDDDFESTPQGRKFMRTLIGASKLGPVPKYIIIDGDLRVTEGLGAGRRARLVAVRSVSEKAYDPNQWLARFDATDGCQKDPGRRAAWIKSLTTPPRR